jgi:hypothetical protein
MKQLTNNLFKIFFGLTVFLIPWQTRWIFFDQNLAGSIWEYGRVSLYASMLTLVLALVFFYWQQHKKVNFRKIFDSSRNKILILTIFYFWLVNLFSPIPQIAIYYLALILLAIIWLALSHRVSLKLIYGSLLASGAVQGCLAIWQTMQQRVLSNKWFGIAEHLPEIPGTSVVEYGLNRVLRAYGSLPHPNILGGFLVIASLAGLWWWAHIYEQAKKDNWSGPNIKRYLGQLFLVVAGLVVVVMGLLLTFSRSALVALLLIIIISLFIALWKQAWLKTQVLFKFLIITGLLFLGSQLLFPGAWTARWQIEQRLEVQSVTQRVSSWQQIHWQGPKAFLFGQGLGMNTYVNLEADQPAYDSQPIHNIFLLAFAEVGLIGILLLLNLLRLFRPKKIGEQWPALLIAILVLGSLDHYLWTSWTGWLLLAIILASFREKLLK